MKGEHVKIPLDISILQENVPFVYENEADLASVKIDDKWQLQLFLTSYLLDNIAVVAFNK